MFFHSLVSHTSNELKQNILNYTDTLTDMGTFTMFKECCLSYSTTFTCKVCRREVTYVLAMSTCLSSISAFITSSGGNVFSPEKKDNKMFQLLKMDKWPKTF